MQRYISKALTISPRMITSQDALTIYIFHPMFCKPMGMMKTKSSLIQTTDMLTVNPNSHPHSYILTHPLARSQHEGREGQGGGGGDSVGESHSRRNAIHDLRKRHAIGTDGIVEDLGRVQVQQGRPGDRVGPLEEKHDGHVAVDKTLRCAVGAVGVHFGQAPDNEQTGDQEGL